MAGSMLQPCNLRSGSFTSGRPVARSSKPVAARSGRSLCANVQAGNVLIANTKGGGHAFIGLHLAKQLLDSGHSVTILNDGDEVSRLCTLGLPSLDWPPAANKHLLHRQKVKVRRHTVSMTA